MPCAPLSRDVKTTELTRALRTQHILLPPVGSDDSLDCGALPTSDHAQVKTSRFHKPGVMSETDNKTTFRLLSLSMCESSVCVADHKAGFQVHDNTRNDNAQRHTNTQIRMRLLSQQQQLSQHASVSSDLCACERAFQCSSCQINAQILETQL